MNKYMDELVNKVTRATRGKRKKMRKKKKMLKNLSDDIEERADSVCNH